MVNLNPTVSSNWFWSQLIQLLNDIKETAWKGIRPLWHKGRCKTYSNLWHIFTLKKLRKHPTILLWGWKLPSWDLICQFSFWVVSKMQNSHLFPHPSLWKETVPWIYAWCLLLVITRYIQHRHLMGRKSIHGASVPSQSELNVLRINPYHPSFEVLHTARYTKESSWPHLNEGTGLYVLHSKCSVIYGSKFYCSVTILPKDCKQWGGHHLHKDLLCKKNTSVSCICL